MRKAIIGIILMIPLISHAQTGPGGVGNPTTLDVWLRASDIGVGDGNEITTWQDQSGNNNDFTSIAGNGGLRPTLDSDAINGNPAILFHGDATRFEDADGENYINGNAGLTLITLIQSDELATIDVGIFDSEDPDGQDDELTWRYDNAGAFGGGDNVIKFGVEAGGQNEYESSDDTHTINPQLLLGLWQQGELNQLYLDGSQDTPTNLGNVRTGTVTGASKAVIGRGPKDNGTTGWNGYVLEFALYNYKINSAERVIIENYLASKYKLSVANDFYVFESTHGAELLGIGQNGVDTHIEAKSSDILTVKNASTLADGDYIFAGHDNNDITTWSTTEQMNGDVNIQRLAREWRVDVTGTPGTVTLSLDATLLPTSTADYDFYMLWTDEDGDFSEGAVAHPLTINGGEFEATGVTLTDGMYIAVSIVRPVIQFISATSSGDEETATSPDFDLSLNYAIYNDIDVDFTFTDGTAVSPIEYTYTDGTSTIATGTSSAQITTASIIGDGDIENDETFTITLSNPEFGVLGTNAVHSYSINDNDNTQLIQFDAPFSYGYKKRFTIDNTKVSGSSDLTDFPVLIAFTDNDLRTTGNGGQVENANGYDIRFTYGNSVIWLDHDLEYYDAATGEYAAWVRIPVLQYDEDTEIDMYYGNAAVATDPSTTTTWVDYHGVFHLGENDVSDATSNNYTSVNSGTVDAAGKTGRSQLFDGGDIIELTNFPNINSQFTVSMWFNTTDDTHNGRLFSDDATNNGWAMSFGDPGDQEIRTFNRGFAGAGVIDALTTFTTGNWYQVVLIVDRVNEDRIIYVNGTSSISDLSDIGTWTTDAGNAAIGGEGTGGENVRFEGFIDEVKISSVVRNADWIATEFNNQDAPGAFYSVGTEIVTTGFTISESTDIVTLPVTINATSASLTQVDYAVTSGTAENGSDYVLAAGTVDINIGDLVNTFDIDITNDLINEVDETVIITLSNPNNANLGTNSSITLILEDDDAAPTVEFVSPSATVNEGTSQFSLAVSLNTLSGQDISVDYTVTGGDATSESDFVLMAGTSTIDAGDLTKSILVNIIDDPLIENPETIEITLSSPSGATLGTNTISTITINDNDNDGIDGPGGVGNIDGSGTLSMWFIADSASFNGSNQITGIQNLVDISNNDLVNTGNMPNYIPNALNGHAEISFNNVNDALVTSSLLSASSFPYNEASTFIVTRHDDLAQQSNVYGTSTTQGGTLGTNRFSASIPENGNVVYDIGNCCGTTAEISFPYDGSWVGSYSIFSYIASSVDGKTSYRNNTLEAGPIAGTSPFENHTSKYFHLGQTETDNFQGDITEFLLFTNPVNSAQRNIIINYLAAKYDLTIANDIYDWQATHSHEVAGIGQIDASNKHVAANAGAITISAPTDLDDNEFIMFGHDNADISTWSTSNIPDGDFQRLSREWRYDLTGAPGSISISIDAGLLPSLPVGYEDYVVIVDANSDFTENANVYPTTFVDGQYITNSIAIAKGDYVTVATIKRKIQFSTASIDKLESTPGLLNIELDYVSGNDITVDYTIGGGTATGGSVDYSAVTSGTLMLLAGQTNVTLDLGIIDESLPEGDETIITTLSNPATNSQLGTNTIFTYTITDDDNDREFNFADPCLFGFVKTITIDNTQVSGSSDLTNFPLLVNITGDTDLAANVTNANGYDIYFKYENSLTWLSHEIEYFDGGAGDLTAWVLLPTLDFDEDAVIEMYYGNASITLNPSSNDVWDEYLGVWHLDDVNDASANSYNGTNNGTDQVTGRFGDGRDFDGAGDFIELASFPNLQQDFSISAWVNATNVNAGSRIFIDDDNNTNGYALSVGDPGAGRLRFYSRNANPTSVDGGAGQAVPAATWTYVTGVADYDAGGSRTLYVNAVQAASVTHTNQMGIDVGSAAIGGETLSGETANRFTGIMDEVRVYNGLLSADRITTEHNNQMVGSSFYTLSTEAIGSACQIAENAGTISVMVAINPVDNASTTTATYTVTGGSATQDVDYTLDQGTVDIIAGESSASFDFTLTNDLLDEIDETLIVTLSNPTSNAKIGTSSTITYTIIDDDTTPTIEFVDNVSSANEGTAIVTIGLVLSAESGSDVTVGYSVFSSTATSGDDYVFPSGTATITAGDLSTNITISIIDDADIEALENIVIDISSPTAATLGAVIQHTMTINDNDDLGFNGPGGVGEIDGSQTLRLWLAADSAAHAGADVTAWGNAITGISGLDFAPVGTSPLWIDAAVNGHAEISFNNVNDGLISDAALSATSFPYNESTFFIVTRTDNLGQASNAYATATAATGALDANQVSANIPSNGNAEFEMSGVNTGVTYQTAWANGDHNIFAHRVTSTESALWRNNNVETTNVTASIPFTNHPDYNFYIGRNETNPFQGDIAELIMFSRPANNSQITIVNNYLSSKYDIGISNDIYLFDLTHGNEVAGIGQTSATDQHVAARAGVITTSNASDLDDGEFVLFGHDNATIDSWVDSNTPMGDSIKRVSREWRFDATGNPGNVTIAIDTTMLPTKILGYQDYVVFVDKDGDFSNASIYQTTKVDGQYKASDIPITSADYVSLGIIIRTIEFDEIISNDIESNSKNVVINLNYPYNQDITFDYSITDGTATGSNVDYSTPVSGSITLLAGQTMTELALGINNDTDIEVDETIEITLQNAPAGFRFSANNVHTYTINDDDNVRNIQFNVDNSSGDESISAISLQVDLSLVDATNPTEVAYAITGGTAEGNPAPDYTFVADTLIIAATQTTGTIDFTIFDDVLSESTETIIISLSNPINANLGTNSTYTYSILDNEPIVELEFQDAITTIDEGGSVAQIVVELSNPSGQDVTIDYTVSGGTATNGGTDFALANGTLTITKGDQIGTINIALTDDTIEETTETIIIDLSTPTASTLGAQTQHIVSIIDNDADFGFYGPGGVGDKESNILWLDAAHINGSGVNNPANGSPVSIWVDRSGNTYDFTAISAGATYSETGLNGNETVAVSTTADGFKAPTNFSHALGNYTFITVTEQSSGQYLAETNTTANNNFSINQGTNGLYHLDGNDRLTGNSSSDIDIMSWTFDEQATPEALIYRDGISLASDNNYSVMAIDNNFSIGARATGESTTDFGGNISEFVIFKKPINSAQRIITENYLSSKYGIAIPNDYYSYDGTYGADVIGIGQEDVSNFHLQSMSDSLFMLSGASSLGDGDYIFAGHDNNDKTTWTVNEAPNSGSNIRRIAREWRLDLTGTPGTAIIKIDTAQLPLSPTGFDQYVIWTDDDGDFRFGATTYQLEYSPIFGFHVSDPVIVSAGTFIAIGVGQPVVEFTVATSDGNEATANPSLEVSLNFTMGSDVTINYGATGGTATGGNVDYLLTSGTLTIPQGQMSANIIPGIIDDVDLESDETIVVTLTTPSSNVSLGGISEHTYTIHDNDNIRDIEFSAPLAANAAESTLSYTVTIEIDVIDAVNPTTVDLLPVLTGDYAEIGVDYTLSTTTVTIPANSSTATFDITIIDDANFENDETITLDLTNPNNAQLGTNDQFVYTINDNDTAPVVQFSETESYVGESSTSGSLEVSLNNSSSTNVTVDYTVSSASATQGLDFTLTTGTLTILAGQSNDNILMTIVDDILVEGSETVTVTISNPSNATLGGNINHLVNIVDNDAAGSVGPGGVGDATTNLLWLSGDQYSGSAWTDRSGNGFVANGGTSPSLTASNINFNNQPTVAFNGTTQYLDANISSAASDYDVFFAMRSDGTTSDQVLYHSDDTDDLRFGYENTTGSFFDQGGAWVGNELTFAGTSILQYNLVSGTADVLIDGSSDHTAPYTATSQGGIRTLGAQSGGSNFFSGDIGEVIMYNSVLNDAQRIIVLNYLSSKYAIDISASGDDRYAHDGSGFTENLIGIGREDATNLHIEATQENYFTIKNPNNLDDAEYLMTAHEDININSWVTTEVPNASTFRLQREWRVDMTGDVGTVSIEVDINALPAPAGTGLSWALLVDSDGDFTTVDNTYILTTVSGSIVGVNGVTLNDDDHFTFAQVKFETIATTADFNLPTTWSTGIVPYAGVDVTINAGHDIFMSADATIGSMTIENGGNLDLSGQTLEFTDGCITLNGTGAVDVVTSGSTIAYVNPNIINQCITSMTYNNLFTSGTTGSIKYLLGDIVVNGDIELTGASGGAFFDARNDGTSDDYDISLDGNWTSEITFLPRTGMVTLNGTLDQVINTQGGETFNNLTVNKASGEVQMSSEININSAVTMTQGNLALGTQDLNIVAGGTIVSGDVTSYIVADNVGVLRHAITTTGATLTFPIGDSDDYAPFIFTLNTGTLSGSNVTINMRDTKHTNIIEDNYITRYWSLNNEGITGTLNYNVSYNYQNADIVGTESLIQARKFSLSGDAIGGTYDRGANQLNFTGHTSFSDHTGESAPIVLPVELLSFYGGISENGVQLEWVTASEINNDYFEIERSTDGIHYETVGKVDGNGTVYTQSTYGFLDTKPYYGISYYRLVQVDFDGAFNISESISINYDLLHKGIDISLFPNPTHQSNINVRIVSGDENSPINIIMYDLQGRTAHQETLAPRLGISDHIIRPLGNLSRGVYQVIVTQGTHRKIQKIIIN